MNKFFILIIFLSSSLFAVIDERKSDIYYGNGIMTTEIEAQLSLDRVGITPQGLNLQRLIP